MDVVLAQPRGFCAGVDRAIEIVERALAQFGAPIYVRHEIVHNTYVVQDLRAKGAIFVDELHEIPAGSTVIFSAHGVSKEVRREAAARGLQIFDATCPLVTKVHVEVAKMRAQGRELVMIGHAGNAIGRNLQLLFQPQNLCGMILRREFLPLLVILPEEIDFPGRTLGGKLGDHRIP